MFKDAFAKDWSSHNFGFTFLSLLATFGKKRSHVLVNEREEATVSYRLNYRVFSFACFS